jgi:hypothetical protein
MDTAQHNQEMIKRHANPIVVILAVVGVIGIVVALVCGLLFLRTALFLGGGGSSGGSGGYIEDETISVTYYVSGVYLADLTMENGTGGTEQKEGVVLPYTRTISMKKGDFMYISAQNALDHGTIKCEILVNGVTFKKAESSGAYTIATCNGSYR